jgi:hypothetical protein
MPRAPKQTTAPAVIAVVRGRALVVLACPYCGGPHVHGLAGGPGLRTAHCSAGAYRLHISTGTPPIPSQRRKRGARR